MKQEAPASIGGSSSHDLSQGEFDVVIADVEASTTQRQSQLWSLIEAVSRLRIPGDLVFESILELVDLPNKQAIKEKWAQQQQVAQAQHQAMLELERVKNENINQSIAFKDAPLPIQLAMAAKQGLLDPQIAEYAINVSVQQMFPQLAQAMAQQITAQQQA